MKCPSQQAYHLKLELSLQSWQRAVHVIFYVWTSHVVLITKQLCHSTCWVLDVFQFEFHPPCKIAAHALPSQQEFTLFYCCICDSTRSAACCCCQRDKYIICIFAFFTSEQSWGAMFDYVPYSAAVGNIVVKAFAFGVGPHLQLDIAVRQNKPHCTHSAECRSHKVTLLPICWLCCYDHIV